MSQRNDQSLSIEALCRPECYGADVKQVRIVETHISWVFLTGRYAYKVKKPLKLPFLDFSTLAQRRHFCEQELALNRRLAPEIYLEVVGIGGDRDAPRVGAEPTLEYAVKMLQFPDDARLDRRLASNDVPADAVVAFAGRLARFHIDQPPIVAASNGSQAAEATIESAESNLEELRAYLARLDRSERDGERSTETTSTRELRERTDGRLVDRLAAADEWTEQQCAAIGPLLAERFSDGHHRDGHGDLHLENLILRNGEIVAFDALEFNPLLRRSDVMSETGFLTMDLLAHGHGAAAYRFLNRYLEVGGDYNGLRVLRFYLVYRALVRAKVRAIKAAQHPREEIERSSPRPYLDAAFDLVRPRTPLLAITHGLSGSGKTHVSNELIGRIPALRARSDLERKRLQGLGAKARSHSTIGAGLYDRASTERTYERLAQIARYALRGQFDLIVDAAFLDVQRRRAFHALAEQEHARFTILDCAAPDAVLRERLDSRAASERDASEADRKVLDYQLEHREPLSAAETAVAIRIDTANPIDYDALAAACCA